MDTSTKTVLIAGGSGTIGQHLCALLKDRFRIRILSRSDRYKSSYRAFKWQPYDGYIDPEALRDVEVVVNLSGTPFIDKPWTEKRKAQIMQSRILSTAFLGLAIHQYGKQVKLLINASAIGIYGPTNGIVMDELSPIPDQGDFAWEVCQNWEQTLFAQCPRHVIPIALRIGLVLTKDSGLFPNLLPGTQFGIGAHLGDRQQVLSWIHKTDLVRMIAYLIEHNQTSYPKYINATAPYPVNFGQILKSIIKARGSRPRWLLSPPGFILRGILGDRLKTMKASQLILPTQIQSMGFRFKYPTIDEAVTDLLT